MKFSLFYEMQIADPTPESEARLFHECAEQVELADRLGYHAAWEVEHHGLYEYSHSSAPEVFLAYVAGRTTRIKLGHGVTLTPGRYNHPIRIAERVATLDILSRGRVLWGSGKSASATEQGAFGADPRLLHEQWAEALEMIPRMWRDEPFAWKGKHWEVPPTQIVPKPVQRPHPPIFAACAKPDSAVAVGKLGIGALNFALGDALSLEEKVRGYKQAVRDARPEGRQKNDWFACTPVTLCLPDDREAVRWGLRGATFFQEALATYYFSGQRPLGRLPIPRDLPSEDDVTGAMELRGAPEAPALNVIGDPARCREQVERFAAAGVDELILVMQVGTVPHEMVMRSIQLFGEQVLPHFA